MSKSPIELIKKSAKYSKITFIHYEIEENLNDAIKVIKKNNSIPGIVLHAKNDYRDQLDLITSKFINILVLSIPEAGYSGQDFLDKSYELIKDILNNKDSWLEDYVKWELLLLNKIGYGLQLNRCIVSNSMKNLVFVSPKSGCAVSRTVAAGYEKKLLILPEFLISGKNPSLQNIREGLSLTTFFLIKFAKSINKSLPFTREYFIDSI